MRPRKHQLEAMHIVDEIISGAPIRDILFYVTPGGGKSMIPIIFSKLIQAGRADAICWICPRKSLQYQGEANCADPFFRQMFGHTLSIRASTNEPNPCRGLNGFITTYQAIGLDITGSVLQEIRSKRYILVLDEFHHAEEDSLWENKLQPIYDAARFRVKMTGTLERHSGKKVAFTTYDGIQVSTEPNGSERIVRYTRQDALAERAIIPLHFTFNDASVRWIEGEEEKDYDSLSYVPAEDTGKALYTAINTDYAQELIYKALDHWTEHRRTDQSAKMLIVAAKISNAQEALETLRSRYRYCEIATSAETEAAQEAIRRFKQGDTHILVTVAMAYEGMDVPEVSHIVCLTNIRSTPWIEQMLARAVRVNKAVPYEQQYGYVYTMDDPRMHEIVMKIRAEQLPFLRGRGGEQMGLFDQPGESTKPAYDIEPMASSLTNGREYTLGEHWPALDHEIEYRSPATIETPSDIERRLRNEIESAVRRYCSVYRLKEQKANAQIKTYFQKGRSEMTIPELEECLEYVNRIFAVNGTGRRRTARREAVRYYG